MPASRDLNDERRRWIEFKEKLMNSSPAEVRARRLRVQEALNAAAEMSHRFDAMRKIDPAVLGERFSW
jgi:hypothetical protein